MPEAVARSKFSCPACGAEAVWNPREKKPSCAIFAGPRPPPTSNLSGTGATDAIVEHDLATPRFVRSRTKRAAGKREKTEVRCQSCQAISVFDATRVGQRCDFCGSAALVPYEAVKASFRPESLLEFKLAENQVRDAIHAWQASRWFCAQCAQDRAATDTVKGLYIPYWTFDAQAHAIGPRKAGTIITRPKASPIAEANVRPAKFRKFAGRPAPASWSISLTMSWFPPPAGYNRTCWMKSSHFRPRN